MAHLRGPVLDPVLAADPVEEVRELDAALGQDRVQTVGEEGDHRSEQVYRRSSLGLLVEFGIVHLPRPPRRGGCGQRGDEEVELALLGCHLSDVDVDVTDGVARELAFRAGLARSSSKQ